jgi:hypothetical protein
MSIAGILDAMRSERPPAERLVWQCLENHANGHRCWAITEQAMADELKLGVATVARAVRALEADKIIEMVRFKRRPTLFKMKRNYPKPNGQHPPSPDDLTHQNDQPTGAIEPELTTQNDQSTHHLTHQSDQSTHHLTHQSDQSTAPLFAGLTTQFDQPTPELTHQNDASTPELTHQIDQTSNPPVRIHQEENPPERRASAPKARAKALPDGWQPHVRSFALGFSLGMNREEVLVEAAQMRDWASHKGETGLDWNARFDRWLRTTAQRRLPPLRLVSQATAMPAREARYASVQDVFRRQHAEAKAREMVQ